MPIIYTCKSCGTSHSKNQYVKSIICKECGTLLISQFITKQFNSDLQDSKNITFQKEKSIQKEIPEHSNNYFSLQKAAENLTSKSRYKQEYSLFSNTKKTPTDTDIGENSWGFLDSEHIAALKLKKKLIKKFEKKTFEQSIPGKVVSNKHGKYYSINHVNESSFKQLDFKKCKKLILSDLKIMSGIGNKRESDLKKSGYSSIQDLTKHPIWKEQASEFTNLINKKRIGLLQSRLWKSVPKSHPLIHYLAGLNNPEDFAIVDIETLGLSERPIILLGIAKIRKNVIHTNQFLLRHITDEPSAIWAFTAKIRKNCSLISYNGRSFDIPYVAQRLAYYGIKASIDNPHFDLLHFTRRALGHKLRNCRLETVEEYLQIERGINIPGALVPDFYQTYLKTGNVGPLVAIVEHNRQDLVTLATLFSRLYEEWNK